VPDGDRTMGVGVVGRPSASLRAVTVGVSDGKVLAADPAMGTRTSRVFFEEL